MPLFTLVYPTIRPGGLDLLVESLKNQSSDLYELVVVDGYSGRIERAKAIEYILNSGIPLRAYVPPFIPLGGDGIKKGYARALNAGAIWSTTDYVVFMQDYSWCPPGLFCQWAVTLAQCQANTMICGVSSLRVAHPPIELQDITIWPGRNCWQMIGTELELHKPHFFEMMHSAVPIYFFEATNGLDERKSTEAMGEAFIAQGRMLGFQTWVEPKIYIGMVEHKQWGGELWDTRYEKKSTPEPEIDIKLVSPNPYDFKGIRDEILGKPWNGAIGL